MEHSPGAHDLPPRSPRAAWGLACGLVGAVGAIPFVPLLEYVFAPAAIVLGILGFRDVSHGMRGKGFSAAAIALGILVIGYKLATSG